MITAPCKRVRDHAVAYYTQAGNIEKMAEGYYILEDFTELERLLGGLPDDHALLEVHCCSNE